ncbi:MAG: bifunctional ornithine acetyltransferase/N-acetylglutamate synthase [Lachnospiraceae bacterium]|nr:bifunctional ornithine acetyltransferase/N-acetylglutamate synthase [Lachnospiraceae bacterium]
MKVIDGGVCAPKGFTANGINVGIKPGQTRLDLGMIFSEVPASAAAVYTTNLVKGAPITVTKDNISDGVAQAAIFNSGNANTCNADGIEIAKEMCSLLAEEMKIRPEDVIVASTGVIGQRLKIDPIAKGMASLCSGLNKDGSDSAARAVMTTDTVKKEIAVEFELGGKTCSIAGIAKGSGMIHPNMATMLAFLTTDAAISSEMLKKALSNDIEDSFNMISVDGDTSTNDMVCIMANGMAGNDMIVSEGEAFDAFSAALSEVTIYLARNMAKDGEGASKLIICKVSGADDKETAKVVAKSVICSNLLKCAIFGSDANWGRVLCAIGYSGADVDVTRVDVSFSSAAGEIQLCKDGAGVDFSEEKAKAILDEAEITILVSIGDGDKSATAYGCDLTYEYVNINGSYRS